jgi:predicted nucleotidyltransferase
MRKININSNNNIRRVNNSRTQVLNKKKRSIKRKNYSGRNPKTFERNFSKRKNPFDKENMISFHDDEEYFENNFEISKNQVVNELYSGSEDSLSNFEEMEQERIREDKENGYKLVFSKNHGNIPPKKLPSSKSSVSENLNINTTDILPHHSDDEKEIFNILKNKKDLSNLPEREISTPKKILDQKLKTQKIRKLLNTPKSNVPWVSEKTIESLGIVKLHYEILDFFHLIKATDEENTLRVKTFNLFNRLIKNKWPNWNVELFGSFPNNIHLPDSDIDVVVLKENITSHSNFNSYIKDSVISEGGQLNLIYREILTKGFVDEIRYVDAKVPIIKIKCKETQVRMDIS